MAILLIFLLSSPKFLKSATKYLGPTFARREEDGDEDWRYFYVNMYVTIISLYSLYIMLTLMCTGS
jgi:hypothetical protein